MKERKARFGAPSFLKLILEAMASQKLEAYLIRSTKWAHYRHYRLLE
jgi:hypothetical protein